MEQQNRYHVIVSERATQMLVSHAAFLAQVSPKAAERLTLEFEKNANSLDNHAAEMSAAHRGIYSQKRLSVYPV